MTISFGSAQTNGRPLIITAITSGARQLLHTFPAGSATPNLVSISVLNLDTNVVTNGNHTLFLTIEDNLGTILATMQEAIPAQPGLYQAFSDAINGVLNQLVLNGASLIKVYADTANVLAVMARVDNQTGSGGGTAVQNIASGLVASVQNANRFAVNAQGGTGQATEANANILIGRAGTLQNLRAKSDAAVGGGATVTVAVRINGVTSGLTLTFVNADGTGLKTNTAAIPVASGDLVTFLVACDNAGAPAANLQASVEYVAA